MVSFNLKKQGNTAGEHSVVPPKSFYWFTAGIAVIAILLVMVIEFEKSIIRVDHYLTVKQREFDGDEFTVFYIDWDKIFETRDLNGLVDREKMKDVYGKEYDLKYSVGLDEEIFRSCAKMEFEEGIDEFHLKNGDTIKYNIVIDEKLASCIDIKLKGGSGTFIVTGLEP